MSRLVDDLLAVVTWAVGRGTVGPLPRLVLVGHSLGGAIAIRLAADPRLSGLVTVSGLVVVEMVEGSALASLDYMRQALTTMPRRFDSVEQAVQWSVGHGVIKNLDSARISVPAQLREVWRPLPFSSLFIGPLLRLVSRCRSVRAAR
jgi:protein phosphatase methylesterase 1